MTLACSALLLACSESPETLPARGHHVVYVDTDAWLAPGLTTAADPGAPPVLFDRLELAVLRPGEDTPCAECVRVFSVDQTLLDEGASMTIVPPPGTRPRVRARLYRRDSVFEGILREETAVEVVAQLPPTPTDGALETTLLLLTDHVGVPRGTLTAPLEVSSGINSVVRPGPVAASLVGTWEGSQPIDCLQEPGQGEVCVRGGAYWMGNPLAKGNGFAESDRQRLVIVSPFYLDKREVTVGEFRAWAYAQSTQVEVLKQDASDPSSEEHFCTYRDEPDALNDARPVSCVGWDAAVRYCEDQGGVLPSEAQFEYVSSALRSALYIWGQDELAVCGGAVWGRAGRIGTAIEAFDANQCAPPDPSEDGPLPVPTDAAGQDATRLTDRIDLRGGLVFDLAGNLQEWMLDYYNGQDEPCWSSPDRNVYRDPVCNTPGAEGGRAVRGGSWLQDRAFLRAAYRTARAPEQGERFKVGFRCARRADPLPAP